MKQLGDIKLLNGAEIEPVNVITGGSPCQNLSIAGDRSGLNGDQSCLFREQIRLAREMRKATNGICPRFMVWENVPGALSTNKGRDFKEVLNEFVKTCECAAPDVPMPKGNWPKSGILYDEMGRWSIAWRVHDAQYWGVPQRRRRIALVCDFRGMSAPEVLFESKSVPGNFDTCNPQGKRTSEASVGSVEESDKIWDARGNGNGRLSATITGDHDNRITDYTNVVVSSEPYTLDSNALSHGLDSVNNKSTGRGVRQDGTSPTLTAGHVPGICYRESYSINGDAHESGVSVISEVSHALKTTTKESIFVKSSPCICIGNGQAHVTEHYTEELSQTLNCMHDPMTIVVDRAAFNQGKNAQFDIKIEETETVPSLVARGPHAVAQPVRYRVRRLTPLECTRLQGYPNNWVDIGDWIDSKGKKHKEADAPKYKALGNSIALPFWKWLLERIYKKCEGKPTLGSLFDGIGGFPLCWPGRTAWSSEIEEFPLAVLRKHFNEE